MAKLKNNTSLSDTMRNKSSLIKKLLNAPYLNAPYLNAPYLDAEVLSFGYYMATQSDHLYNLSYYIDQLQNYKEDITVFENKYKLYSRMFKIFTYSAQCSLQSNVGVSVYIDNLYVLTNKKLKYEKEEYLEELQKYEFALDRELANKFDLKSNINKKILLKILCNIENETIEMTINKSLSDLGFEDLTDSGLDDKLSTLIIKAINKLSLQLTRTQTKQKDEKK